MIHTKQSFQQTHTVNNEQTFIGGIVQHFGNNTYLLSFQELDENIDTILMSLS